MEFALFAVFAFLGQKSRRKQNANKYNTPNQESFMRKILTKIVTLFLITVFYQRPELEYYMIQYLSYTAKPCAALPVVFL